MADMTAIEASCSQCGGIEFDDGFIEDAGESSHGFARWIPGPLERGIFGGAFRFGKPRYIIKAQRCTICSKLTLYVTDQV